MKASPAKKKIRLTLDLTPGFYQRLEDLETLVTAESKASSIREALQLYEYIAKKHKEGYTFKIQKGNEEDKIVFFHLDSRD